MKKILILLILVSSSVLAHEKDSTSSANKEVIIGYGATVLGKNGHLLFGYHLKNSLFYAGLRWQENAHYNPMVPDRVFIFRHDDGGFPLGVIGGFQQNFPLKNFGITPLFFAELEYAYLNSSEDGLSYNQFTGETKEVIFHTEARSIFVPAMGLGFEANIYKRLYLKQIVGVNALFDYNLPRFGFPGFNGLNATVRFSLVYKF